MLSKRSALQILPYFQVVEWFWHSGASKVYSIIYTAMNDFKRLLKYLRPHLSTFVLAFVAMIFGALFETATGALLVPILTNTFNTGQNTRTLYDLEKLIPENDWFAAWAMISFLLISFRILGGISEYFSAFLMAKIGQSAVLQLRQELYAHLLNQSALFFQKHRTNFLVSRLVASAAAIELAVSSNLRDVLRESVMLVAFLSAGFYYNWRLMLGAIIITPIIGVLTSKFSKSLRKLSEESYEGNKFLTDTAQESLANFTIVNAYRAEEREKLRFANVAKIIARANLRSGKIAALSPPIITLIGILALVVFLFFGLREINTGRMEGSQFFAFLFSLFASYDPMR